MVQIWEFVSGRVIQKNMGHSAPVVMLEFSPDDKQLISVAEDGTVLVWNVYL